MECPHIITNRAFCKSICYVRAESVPSSICSTITSAPPPLYCIPFELSNSHFSSLFKWSSCWIKVELNCLDPRICIFAIKFGNIHLSWFDSRYTSYCPIQGIYFYFSENPLSLLVILVLVLLTSRVLLLLGMVGVMLLTHVGLLLLTMLLAKVWLLLGGNDDSTRIYGIWVSVWCSRSAIQINFFALEISQSASASRSCMWACILVCLWWWWYTNRGCR